MCEDEGCVNVWDGAGMGAQKIGHFLWTSLMYDS